MDIEIQEKIQKLKNKNDILKEKLESLNIFLLWYQKKSIEKEIAANNEEIEVLKDKLLDTDPIECLIDNRRKDNEKKYMNLNEEIKKLKNEIQKLEQKIKKLECSLNPFNKNFSSYINKEEIKTEIEATNQEIDKKRAELEVANEEIKELEGKLNIKNDKNLQTSIDHKINTENNDITFANTTNYDEINSYEEQQLIEMQYGDKYCPPCTIL